jgi:acetyl esterase
MPLDPHARRFLDRLAASAPRASASLGVEERRSALEQLLGLSGREPVAGVAEAAIPVASGSLPIRIYTPQGVSASAQLPGLVFFHGGGLVAGSLESHDAICRSLANATGWRLISVGYRLAPEAPFPAAVEDAWAATQWVAGHAAELGIDSDRMGVCGDSAGATLAAVVCQAAASRGAPRLAVQILLCPILDHAGETDSRRALAEGYFVDRGTLAHDLSHYLGSGDDRADPRISPLRAQSFAGLPPTCIHTAEFDPLRDEGELYARRLTQAGVKASYRCHAGMIHLFYGLRALIPSAAAAYESIGGDLRALLV